MKEAMHNTNADGQRGRRGALLALKKREKEKETIKQFMQHKKRDASQAMQGHPRLHEGTSVRIQSSIRCSRVNTSLLCIRLFTGTALAGR